MCVSYFAKQHGIQINRRKAHSRIGEGTYLDETIIVAKPQTFMNSSGKAVHSLFINYHINIEDLVIIHDDLDLPFGRIRVRKGGSSGGHKGIQSIISSIGTEEFVRIRVGIGRPVTSQNRSYMEEDIINYVLGGFSDSERLLIDKIIIQVYEALETYLKSGLVSTMNNYNKITNID